MPSGGFIDITLTSDDGIEIMRRRVTTYEMRLTDHTEPLTEIGQDLLQSFGANFVSQGGEFAGGWAPLAPSTLQKKRSQVMMVESGRLMGSLTNRGGENVFNVTPNSLEVGTSVPYAGYHQHGTSKMPARMLVGWSLNMRQQVVRRFNEWVQRVISQG